jgi:hypothetical protein
MIYLCFKLMIIFALSMCFHCVFVKFPMGPQHVPNMDPPQVPNGSSTCSQHWILHKFPILGLQHVANMDPPQVPNIGSSTCCQHGYSTSSQWVLNMFPTLDPPLEVSNGSSTCSQHWIFHLKFPMVPQHVPNIGSST